MQYESSFFRKPSTIWMYILIPVNVLLLIGTTNKFLTIVSSHSRPDAVNKLILCSLFGCLLLAVYALIGYIYVIRAVPLKNKLVEIGLINDRIIFNRFKRYFINEELLREVNFDTKRFVRLSQKDLKEIANILRRT